jgi:predicted site-specific integrase-resolvase
MGDGSEMHEPNAQVDDLEDQVTAFTGLGEALKEVDGVLAEVSQELAQTRPGSVPLRTRWTGAREVRAVALA